MRVRSADMSVTVFSWWATAAALDVTASKAASGIAIPTSRRNTKGLRAISPIPDPVLAAVRAERIATGTIRVTLVEPHGATTEGPRRAFVGLWHGGIVANNGREEEQERQSLHYSGSGREHQVPPELQSIQAHRTPIDEKCHIGSRYLSSIWCPSEFGPDSIRDAGE
jgi:hypothetical protein